MIFEVIDFQLGICKKIKRNLLNEGNKNLKYLLLNKYERKLLLIKTKSKFEDDVKKERTKYIKNFEIMVKRLNWSKIKAKNL